MNVKQRSVLEFHSFNDNVSKFFNELDNNISYYCVAKNPETNQIIGYLGSWLIVDECHITNVAVHPDFRRQKIAEQLLIQLIEHCYEQFIKYN